MTSRNTRTTTRARYADKYGVANYLGFSVSYIEKLIARGELPVYKIPGPQGDRRKTWRFNLDHVDAWMERHLDAGPDDPPPAATKRRPAKRATRRAPTPPPRGILSARDAITEDPS